MMIRSLRKTDMDTINKALERSRDFEGDGHFTLCAFTTQWAAGFFTPTSREDIAKMSTGPTAEAATLIAMDVHSKEVSERLRMQNEGRK
jgi:hypothetical protein